MKDLNLWNIILKQSYFIIPSYVVFVIFQLIWLYYEFNLKNVILFSGNKIALILSIIFWYFFDESFYGIFFYVICIISLVEYLKRKYNLSFLIQIENIFLQDVIFVVASSLILNYLI